MHKVRVWDLPTRVFHWALFACVVGLFVTGSIGGNLMVWHMQLGYCVGALLLFRLVWGFIGGKWSRFASFVPTPRRLASYFRGTAKNADLGHNPLGGMSVLFMLGVLGLQVSTGLVSDDEIAFTGPLYRFVSGEISSLATWYHKDVGKLMVLGLIALHICAILFYQLLRRKRLVQAMLTGDQNTPDPLAPSSADTPILRAAALVVFLACWGLVCVIAEMGAGPAVG